MGMSVAFAGLVCALSQHQKLERHKRLEKAEQPNNK